MLNTARTEDRIAPAMFRVDGSEASVRFLGIIPVLIFVLAGFMAMKCVGRRISEVELITLSGVSTALMWLSGILFLLRQNSS